MLGYIYSFTASIFMALYYVPRKFSKASSMVFTLYFGIGWFTFALATYLLNGLHAGKFENLANPLLLFNCLAGLSRMIGTFAFFSAIQKAGLTRANQWRILSVPIGSITSLIFLYEFTQVNISYVIAGIITILISATLFTISNSKEAHKNLKLGILLAFVAAFCYGINQPMQKYVTMHGIDTNAQNLCAAFTMFASMAIYMIIKTHSIKIFEKPLIKDHLWGVAAGVGNSIAMFFNIIAYTLIPASIGYPITQLNAVWTALIGIWFFKEVEFKKHWIRISIGFLFALLSIYLLLHA